MGATQTQVGKMRDPFDLAGHRVWITGSARGIGAAMARAFARAGADVVVHGLGQQDEAAALCTELRALGVAAMAVDGDVTDQAAAAGMAAQVRAEFGGVSVLVNCVGGSPRKSTLANVAPGDIAAVLGLNLISAMQMTQAALPMLRAAAPRASIINISGTVARGGGVPGGGVYATAKGGVEAYTRALAKELAPEGIRVNCVAPGLIDTPFHGADAQALYPQLIARIPLGRIGQPEDIAGPAVFLASDAAGFITGEVIEASGGTRLQG